jgi:hypothetical protein
MEQVKWHNNFYLKNKLLNCKKETKRKRKQTKIKRKEKLNTRSQHRETTGLGWQCTSWGVGLSTNVVITATVPSGTRAQRPSYRTA